MIYHKYCLLLYFQDYSIVLILEEQIEDKKSETEKKDNSLSLSFRVFVNRGLLYLKDLNDAYNAALDFESANKIQADNIQVLHTMALCYHKYVPR